MKSRGFTVVELIIVIVVIGILASIVYVSYNRAQLQAATATLQNDLKNAQDAMEIAAISTHEYPDTLPASAQTSPDSTLTLKTAPVLPHYSSLTPVQSGVLLSSVCDDLIAEGKGKGVNMGGGTDAYITWCGNWNHDSIQITGWDSETFQTPIQANTLTDWADDYSGGDAWHPNQNAIVKGFYYSLRDRYITQGGTFPITSFWDSWADEGNGGTVKEELPDPDPSDTYVNTYCIEATYENDRVQAWHIIQDGQPAPGGC